MHKYIYIIHIIMALVLSSCEGPKCIDADDFGFEKVTIPARYKPEQLVGSVLNNSESDQVAPWINSNLRVNGDPLTIVVKNWQYLDVASGYSNNNTTELSAWSPWLSTVNDVDKLSDLSKRLITCKYIPNGDTCNGEISNAPCLMKKGMGLYAYVAPKRNNKYLDPNENVLSMKNPDTNPKGCTFHLGDPVSGYTLFDIDDNGDLKPAGGVVYKNLSKDLGSDPAPLYFKILDSNYDDNSGQYRIVIKSGVNSTKPDPIKFLQDLVDKKVFGTKNSTSYSDVGVVRQIFDKIVKNTGYQKSVNVVLTIYIIITGMLFLIGSIQMTQAELITRVIKVVIIAQLISGSAYSFFYNNLFFLFIDGWNFLQNIIDQAGVTGPGGGSIVSLMLSYEIFAKLSSLLFTSWMGWIYIIIYLVLLIFILFVFFQATIIILTAKLAIGMMIIISPIFLCLMLFNFSKPIFQGWFKQLISFTLQPLILYTGITLISTMIRHEIYATLGFKVCKYDIPDLGDMSKIIVNNHAYDTSIFSWWFPNPINPGSLAKPGSKTMIPVPEAHIDKAGNFCSPYGCNEERYPDLPFLDPNPNTKPTSTSNSGTTVTNEINTSDDSDAIKDFRNGQFINWNRLLILFLVTYLLYQFNKFAVQLAMVITGDGGSFKLNETSKNFSKGVTDKVKEYASSVKNYAKGKAWDKATSFAEYLGKARSPRSTNLSFNDKENSGSNFEKNVDNLFSSQNVKRNNDLGSSSLTKKGGIKSDLRTDATSSSDLKEKKLKDVSRVDTTKNREED